MKRFRNMKRLWSLFFWSDDDDDDDDKFCFGAKIVFFKKKKRDTQMLPLYMCVIDMCVC